MINCIVYFGVKGQYDEIIKYLKADDKSAFPWRIGRRVADRRKSNSYQLMSFPVLGIEDILCIAKKNKVG